MLTRRPRRRPDRRSLKTMDPGWDLPPTPPAASVTVTSVQFNESQSVVWYFSSSLQEPVPETPAPQFQVNDSLGSGWVEPVEMLLVSGNALLLVYEGVNLVVGSLWRVLSPPAGVSFADGELVVPESGTVTG